MQHEGECEPLGLRSRHRRESRRSPPPSNTPSAAGAAGMTKARPTATVVRSAARKGSCRSKLIIRHQNKRPITSQAAITPREPSKP